MMKTLRIATRGSALALTQAELVRTALQEKGIAAELILVTTKGDADKHSPLKTIGGNGLFVREVEKRLLSGEADLAVHCGKDLPYEIAPELTIAGVLPADDLRDCLVTRKGETLPDAPVIGTGSRRRASEYARINANAVFREIRGNVGTRIEKLKAGEYDGIFLAKAGLNRLKITDAELDVRVFDCTQVLPAACQGILALQCRKDDGQRQALLAQISDKDAMARFEIERQVFCALRADCSAAVAVYAEIRGEQLTLRAMFEGKHAQAEGALEDSARLCAEICRELKP